MSETNNIDSSVATEVETLDTEANSTVVEDALETVHFRESGPTDIPMVAVLEKASYPEDEAASKSTLQYRQHHAAPYFRCAVVKDSEGDDNDNVVGYICSTRCRDFEHESMSTHVFNGPLLAIHSVVVKDEYRHKGIATAMLKDYVEEMRSMNDGSMEKLVLLAKQNLLAFYVNCGFSVVRPSAIQHGADQWYDLELDLLTFGEKAGSPCYIVDAFCHPEQAGTGNPAAVVLLKKADATDESTLKWMQMVAQEFNLSETAFVWPARSDTTGDFEAVEVPYHIRYFTPTVQVPLCGHATLASAAVLFQTASFKNKNETKIVFHAPNDILQAELAMGGPCSGSSTRRMSRITMEFPTKPAVKLETKEDINAVQAMLLAGLRIESDSIVFMGLSRIGDLLIEVTQESFQAIGFDDLAFEELVKCNVYERGVIVCCLLPEHEIEDDQSCKSDASPTIDFLSRFFGPKAGVDEDPVTGSAHCVLAPYFVKKLGRDRVVGMQASQRGGIVECVVVKDRVKMTGIAVAVVDGTLRL
jgi:PhzF family phenazine biosynthesis protein